MKLKEERVLVDWLKLEARLHSVISRLENNELISQDEVLKALKQCYAYLSWSEVQRAMKEAREIQKMTQEMIKEMC